MSTMALHALNIYLQYELAIDLYQPYHGSGPLLEKRGARTGKNEWIAGWVWANARTSQMLTIDTIYYPNVCTVTKE